eukprot:TRINITY_DN91081_c0_g1_i1.p1 TRINITY_DN91081_c0_g1~~TRINITY_DN91081_c0_g1_i1.p1  ORF type:complete len:257 (+),score=35.38 TRINITY_DN91081_c0_g1_i1:78-848(+)
MAVTSLHLLRSCRSAHLGTYTSASAAQKHHHRSFQDPLQPKNSHKSTELALASIARMVLTNNVRALRRCALAAQHLVIQGNSVRLRDANAFDLFYATAKARSLGNELAAIEAIVATDLAPKSMIRRMSTLQRKSRLWKEGFRRVVIDALLVGGAKVGEPSAQIKALVDSWKPTFTKMPEPEKLSESLATLEPFYPDLSGIALARPPTSLSILKATTYAAPSAPGKDGILYSAWATTEGSRMSSIRQHIRSCQSPMF